MSRGTFNGPGGTHNRWQVPNAGGSGLGPHHMLHFKNRLNVLDATDQVTIDRNTLQDQGVAVLRVKEREAIPNGDLVGLTVDFNAAGEGGDLSGTCANQGYTDVFYCPNRVGTAYSAYRLEVVNRVGNDSFAPGHGVLLSKSRASGTPSLWIIEANTQDIGMIDFYRPDGTPVPVVRGDPRAAERRHVPRRDELGQQVRVRRHVQPAALLRDQPPPRRGRRHLVRRRRSPLRRRRAVPRGGARRIRPRNLGQASSPPARSR